MTSYPTHQKFIIVSVKIEGYFARDGGGANGEMANLTNEKGKFAIAIFRHFSPFFAIGSF